MKTETEQLNKLLQELADKGDDWPVVGLENTGKALPYIGWFWRTVDFDAPIVLGYLPKGFFGFMENNKWGYPESVASASDSALIRSQCECLVVAPTLEMLQALFDLVQQIGRRTIEQGMIEWADSETWQ